MNRRTGPGVIVLGLAVLILTAGEAHAGGFALPGAEGPRVAFQAGPKDYVPQGLVDFREHLCFVSELSTGAVGIPGCPGSLVFITPLIALGFAWWMGLRHPDGTGGAGRGDNERDQRTRILQPRGGPGRDLGQPEHRSGGLGGGPVIRAERWALAAVAAAALTAVLVLSLDLARPVVKVEMSGWPTPVPTQPPAPIFNLPTYLLGQHHRHPGVHRRGLPGRERRLHRYRDGRPEQRCRGGTRPPVHPTPGSARHPVCRRGARHPLGDRDRDRRDQPGVRVDGADHAAQRGRDRLQAMGQHGGHRLHRGRGRAVAHKGKVMR